MRHAHDTSTQQYIIQRQAQTTRFREPRRSGLWRSGRRGARRRGGVPETGVDGAWSLVGAVTYPFIQCTHFASNGPKRSEGKQTRDLPSVLPDLPSAETEQTPPPTTLASCGPTPALRSSERRSPEREEVEAWSWCRILPHRAALPRRTALRRRGVLRSRATPPMSDWSPRARRCAARWKQRPLPNSQSDK
uniref:Uncharacterized protein n=1 Tax=Setaria viridis TaxID=4556 RepID=A0A4U6WC50_SETVI|nr:hypothetical protein SEVIR_1G238400v2 [Setaria viridis]